MENITLASNILFSIGSFPVTNTFLWTVVASVFLMTFFVLIAKRMKNVPGGTQNVVEMLLEGAYSFTESVIGPGKPARKIFPLVGTMFLFILFSNLLVYIPGQSAFTIYKGGNPVPIFRAIMSDYGLVLVMTLISVITTQIVSIAVLGPFKYVGKFINLKGPLDFFLGIMDLVGEIAKVVSLSFRLFGNIFAGEVLTAVILFLMPFFAPLPFMFLGLLTAVVQAFVFAVLTLVFTSMVVESSAEEGK